ncbi:Argininosuccinate synthase [Labeo rohita]|uniref:Argininosuccinate synthase n=1 Tax=Labeo rohita TaxID=84645 RepID=A0ABQ8MBA3_LABRO|nr:Argininosuccinate synthase [Labeo rohita]
MGMVPRYTSSDHHSVLSPSIQPPGRLLVTARPPSPLLESDAAEIAACRLHPGGAQSCGRWALMTAHVPRRMVTPSPDGPADLESIRGKSISLTEGPSAQMFWHTAGLGLYAKIQRGPFELLESGELKFLSAKTALLTVLTSIKRVGDLQAFPVSEECLVFGPAYSHVVLRPRICAQGSHHSLSKSGGEPASTAPRGGRFSLGVAVSRKSIAHICGLHPELHKL